MNIAATVIPDPVMNVLGCRHLIRLRAWARKADCDRDRSAGSVARQNCCRKTSKKLSQSTADYPSGFAGRRIIIKADVAGFAETARQSLIRGGETRQIQACWDFRIFRLQLRSIYT